LYHHKGLDGIKLYASSLIESWLQTETVGTTKPVTKIGKNMIVHHEAVKVVVKVVG
jgi:hypothetical protein